MDRIINADDSAEHLFVWLRKNRRDVNAWFVVAKDTPDYARLRKAGYRRVIPHGSLAWKLLMLNAQHLISSHVDHPVVRPEAITAIAPPKWRFTFLQHGVIKDDISTWLNGKHIDVFVTSTPGEQESIAGDHTALPLHDPRGAADRVAAVRPDPRGRQEVPAGQAQAHPRRADLAAVADRARAERRRRTHRGYARSSRSPSTRSSGRRCSRRRS